MINLRILKIKGKFLQLIKVKVLINKLLFCWHKVDKIIKRHYYRTVED